MDVRLTYPFSFFRRDYKHADTHDCVYWTACIVWAMSYPFTHMPVTPFTTLSIPTYLNETVYEGYIIGNTSAPSLSNLWL